MNEYLMNTEAITRCLYGTIKLFGFYVRFNRSASSESMYLNINLGTREAPKALHVRISDHPSPQYKGSVRYDYDICASHTRKGAITYLKFLSLFAQQYGKPLPGYIQHLQPGTPIYRKYTIALQHRAAA